MQIRQSVRTIQAQDIGPEAAQIRKGIGADQLQVLQISPVQSRPVCQARTAENLYLHLCSVAEHRGDALDSVQRLKILAIPQFKPLKRVGLETAEVLQVPVHDIQIPDAVRQHAQVGTAALIKLQMINLYILNIRQYRRNLATSETRAHADILITAGIDVKIIIVLNIGKSGIIRDFTAESQSDMLLVLCNPFQEIHIIEIAGVKPDIMQFRQIGEEGGIAQGIGIEIALETDVFQLGTACDRRVVRYAFTIQDFQFFQLFQCADTGDIAQVIAVVQHQGFQRGHLLQERELRQRKVIDVQRTQVLAAAQCGEIGVSKQLAVVRDQFAESRRRKA